MPNCTHISQTTLTQRDANGSRTYISSFRFYIRCKSTAIFAWMKPFFVARWGNGLWNLLYPHQTDLHYGQRPPSILLAKYTVPPVHPRLTVSFVVIRKKKKKQNEKKIKGKKNRVNLLIDSRILSDFFFLLFFPIYTENIRSKILFAIFPAIWAITKTIIFIFMVEMLLVTRYTYIYSHKRKTWAVLFVGNNIYIYGPSLT